MSEQTMQWPKRKRAKGQTMIYKTLLRTQQIDQLEIFFLCNKCTLKGHSETKHHIIRTVSKTNRKIVETETESQQILK
jgi:hypothetical protein